MHTAEFNKWHAAAVKEGVKDNPLFNTAGYFWLALTPLQHGKMVALLKAEKAEEKDGFIYLKNGIGIKL